jgi:hypothetical protein
VHFWVLWGSFWGGCVFGTWHSLFDIIFVFVTNDL